MPRSLIVSTDEIGLRLTQYLLNCTLYSLIERASERACSCSIFHNCAATNKVDTLARSLETNSNEAHHKSAVRKLMTYTLSNLRSW